MTVLCFNYQGHCFITHCPTYNRSQTMDLVKDIMAEQFHLKPQNLLCWVNFLDKFGYATFINQEGKETTIEERWINKDGSEIQFILQDREG